MVSLFLGGKLDRQQCPHPHSGGRRQGCRRAQQGSGEDLSSVLKKIHQAVLNIDGEARVAI